MLLLVGYGYSIIYLVYEQVWEAQLRMILSEAMHADAGNHNLSFIHSSMINGKDVRT